MSNAEIEVEHLCVCVYVRAVGARGEGRGSYPKPSNIHIHIHFHSYAFDSQHCKYGSRFSIHIRWIRSCLNSLCVSLMILRWLFSVLLSKESYSNAAMMNIIRVFFLISYSKPPSYQQRLCLCMNMLSRTLVHFFSPWLSCMFMNSKARNSLSCTALFNWAKKKRSQKES